MSVNENKITSVISSVKAEDSRKPIAGLPEIPDPFETWKQLEKGWEREENQRQILVKKQLEIFIEAASEAFKKKGEQKKPKSITDQRINVEFSFSPLKKLEELKGITIDCEEIQPEVLSAIQNRFYSTPIRCAKGYCCYYDYCSDAARRRSNDSMAAEAV